MDSHISHPSTSHDRRKIKPMKYRLFVSAATTATVLISLLSFPSPTHAQNDFPVGSRRMGFTTLNDALYIQGGFDTDASGQFVSLDLSTSWPVTAPAWTILKDGQLTSHLALAPISAGSNGGPKGSILSVGGMTANNQMPTFFVMYDINSSSWTTTLNSVKSQYPTLEGHAAIADPNTGLVYIIGGYNGTSVYNSLSVFDPKSRTLVSQQSSNAANSLTDVGAVWSTERNSILTFGGSRAPPAATNAIGSDMMEYNVNTKQWKTLSTSGDVPPARLDHCMASSEDGSKIVLFGGTVDGNTYFNTIYILDVKSGKWKQGTQAPVPRTRMACAFHSYQFIAWGGSSGTSRNTMLTNQPIVYDLNTDKWVDNYNADLKEKKTNVGAIVGGLAAVAAIGGAVAFLLIRRRKKIQKEREEAFKSDTLAANMTSMEDDNIKVEAPDTRMEYLNNYPLNKMENFVTSPHQQQQHLYGIQSPAAAYQQYGGDHAGYAASPYMYNTEYGPGGEYGSDRYGAYPTHIQSYSPAPGGDHTQQQQQNPFMSPEDFQSPAQSYGVASSVSSGSSNPFTTATSATPAMASATPHLTPSHDPFQSSQTSPWNGTYPGSHHQMTMSPSPGARAPQVIPENAKTTNYVPPPPPA
ncbi:Leucine-zipper-like transcriptional regulator 1 [Linnemannia zychae]|nr:Leucine-zipper-like transcriptional regulator 1 [Linnemannia zychae]